MQENKVVLLLFLCFSQLYTRHNWLCHLQYQLLILDIKLQSLKILNPDSGLNPRKGIVGALH